MRLGSAIGGLLRDVTLPSLRHHRVRALLTLLGIVLGPLCQ
jgi:hypothetical protein